MLAAGDTYCLTAGHYYVLVTDPDANGVSVCVNLTDQANIADGTVVLNPGDITFVTKPSAIFYARAELRDVRKIEAAFKAGLATQHPPCKPEILAMVQRGLLESEDTPPPIKDYCRAAWRR